MTTTTKPVMITEEQAEFARSRGWLPGTDWGWHTANLWVNETGTTRIYPHYKFGEMAGWVAALFYRAEDNAAHTAHFHQYFKEAIAVHS